MDKIMIAISGGVDSSCAALILKEQGYDMFGATLKLFTGEDIGVDFNSKCGNEQDIIEAKKICDTLGIDHYTVNFGDSFKENVIEKFVEAYEAGLTPNPCILCNRSIKFKALADFGEAHGSKLIATGHYCKSEYDAASDRYLLKRAADLSKDQSYVLYTLSQNQLSKIRFPLGDLTKAEVRKIASEAGFANADKPDSQDICFVSGGKYGEFIEKYRNKKYPHGNFVDLEGNVLGEHKGIINYTIGQRKGLGLSLKTPMYVCEKNVSENKVVLSDEPHLFTRSIVADDVNFIAVSKLTAPMRVKAKARYKMQEQWAVIHPLSETSVKVEFEEPQRALTPGQAIVFYDGDVVVGGGTIK